MTHHAKSYLPAAGHDWALPFYDTITRVFGVDAARRTLLEQARIAPGQRVLDIGCGIGTFAVVIKTLHPGVAYIGLDPDGRALARARRKAARAGVAATFDEGFAHELPYESASFDRVFSSFMVHHLPPQQKPAALREIRRVLRPGGSLHLVDFGGPESARRGLRGRFLAAHRQTRDNFGERIPELMREAGFANASRVSHGTVLAGPISWYRGDA